MKKNEARPNNQVKTVTMSGKKFTAAQQETEDLSDSLNAMEEFILRNWKPILSAFVLIAVVVLIFLVVKDYKAKQDIKSATAYAQVETVEDLEKALNDFGACSAANSARIKLAGILLSKNDFEKSSALLGEVMNDNNEDMYIRIKCAMDSGYILVKAGKTDDAFSRFDAVLSNTQATADQRSEAAYAKALIYFDKKEYDKVQDMLVSVDASTPWSVNAKSLQERIPQTSGK